MYEIYDKHKIGKYIASGTMHRVYRYGSAHVIKFCFIAYPKKSPLRRRIKNDWDVVSRYFGIYALSTQCVVNKTNSKFAEIQPFVTGRYLRKTDLVDKEIRKQFEEILEIQQDLQKTMVLKLI